MPKIEASANGAILIDNKPHNVGNLELLVNGTFTAVAIYHIRFKKEIVEMHPIGEWTDDTDTPFASYQDFIDYLDPFFFRSKVSGGGGFNFTYLANDFTNLNTVAPQPIDAGTIAYVFNSEGTAWLPATMGGSYYPAGIYVSDGSDWVSDRNSIANQLQINVDDIDQLQADLLQEVIDRTNADAGLQLQISNHVNNALIHQEVIQRIEGGRGAANTSNQYLRSDDRVPMNLNGQRLNYNTTLVSLMVSTNGSETWNAEVRKNGVVTPVYTESITASDYEISVPNINFDADDEVQFYCNGTGINRPKMIGIFQRR